MRPSGLTIGWLLVGSVFLLAAPLLPLFLWVGLGIDAALLVLALTDVLLLRGTKAVQAQRTYDDILSLGTANLVTITVENPTVIPLRVVLRDYPPEQCDGEFTISSGALKARGSFTFSYHLTPLRRGECVFGPVTARLKTPLGLCVLQRELVHDGSVKVYPNIQQTKQEQLLSKRMRQRQMGLRAMRLRGRGTEFESLRDYQPDDELRWVDWKASARRGNLMAREYDIERSQQIMLVLDMGRPMASHLDYMTKLDHAINASVLLTYVSAQSDDRVGLMAFADEVVTFMPPGKGRGQLPLVLEQLYPLQPRQVESDYRGTFPYLANRLRKRSLIVIFTDLIDPDSSRRLMDNLSLLHPRHLVLCVALSDYELKEILSGAPADLAGLYQQAMATAVLEDRHLALAQLHQRGILTLDAAPSDLSVLSGEPLFVD